MAFFDDNDGRLVLLEDLSAGLARLTCISVPGSSPDRLPGRGAWANPVIGAFLGAASGAIYAIGFAAGLTPFLAAVLAVACLIAVTGARNERALTVASERLAELLTPTLSRDTGAGVGGTVAIVLSLGARVGALAAIVDPVAVTAAMVTALALSLSAVVAVDHYSPDADEDEYGAPLAPTGPGIVLAGALIAIVIAVLVLPFGAGAAIIAASLCGVGLVYAARRRIDMETDEILGATQPLIEVVVLVVLAASAG